MRCIWILGLGFAGVLLGQSPNLYETIAARNAFGLRPAPTAQTAPPPQADWEPTPDLKLTGLVALPPIKRAALYTVEHGKPPKSYVLGEGEQQDDIKVVSIDPAAGTVRVKNRDVYVVLDFKTHALEPRTSAPP